MDLMLTLASRRISMCLWTPARDTPRSLASSCPDRGNPSLSRAMICTLCATPSSTRLFPRAQSIHVSADDTEIGLIGTKLIPLASKLEKPALKHVTNAYIRCIRQSDLLCICTPGAEYLLSYIIFAIQEAYGSTPFCKKSNNSSPAAPQSGLDSARPGCWCCSWPLS